ncbi:MAG TPA: hypothetical protein VF234_01865 [Limnochordia bacterium]
MRALVLYSSAGRLLPLAQGLAAGLQAAGYRTDLIEASARSGPIPVFGYDLVCVGSAVAGQFGGRVADDVGEALKRCSRLEGKAAAAFVRRRLVGSTRTLKRLMALMEEQGAQVRDFAALSDARAAERFGHRLRWDDVR